MQTIPVREFIEKPVHLWLNKWMVLTAGDMENFNSMTVAWGSIGGLWNKPFVQVFVRPTRHTFGFINNYPTFTLCAFPEKYKASLNIIGTKSGRDCDKIAEAGLTPVKSVAVEAPSFKEASLVIECRKTYWQDMDPSKFLDSAIENSYPNKDYHRIFYGEIMNVLLS